MGAHENSCDIYDTFINSVTDIFHSLSHPFRLSIGMGFIKNKSSVSSLYSRLD